ncbi:LysR family transcriptional regulator [Sphingobium sp. HBC34]|uniref:LysR family transcriptional regulator n=1 Tax=Sphingobium cyanobacteriorum TaxID=3063954 RepID=A0ABT8ZPL7_9SPHN|nr:LysR family transcriptional regulator [Sphingobium sp. HBC34]MDO7836490.1 LysR family transcriptional regulator [Sphingobium sp. HBC34]
MDIHLRPYRAFVRIADLGSFNRAAETLALTQPALSAQIKELERQLGFPLFRRHNRRISLTPEGRLFLDRARRFVMENDWLNMVARDIRENQLRIGVAHHSAAIPERCELIETFMIDQPAMRISILGRAHGQLLSDLRSGEIDVAITIELADVDVGSVIEPMDPGLNRLAIASRQVELALPAGHPLHEEPLPAGALRGVEIATVGRAHGVALSEYLSRHLFAIGAQSRSMPEGDGRSVLRYAAVRKLAAVDLGWFGDPPAGMVRRRADDLDLRTRLTVITPRRDLREGASAFLAFCAGRQTA